MGVVFSIFPSFSVYFSSLIQILNMKFFGLLIILTLVACIKTPDQGNQKPALLLNYTTDGLQLQLQGSATDADGKITSLTVNWGDEKVSKFLNNDFSQLAINHTYTNPDGYEIRVSTIDDFGDSTVQLVQAVVDFKETSLTGIKESMYKTTENEYLILTTNLHTYQEVLQNEKFNLITDVIGMMDIDFIAFQECAQNKSSQITDGIIREDNMALIITNRLKEKYNVDYNYVWNWAHYGWEVWEEGVAVLSKYPLLDSEDRYVSSGTNTTSITSRKIIYGAYQIPEGEIHVFSAHTHWRTTLTDQEQNHQIENIQAMVNEKESWYFGALSVVCGDFNVNPTSEYPWSEGYNTMVKNNGYLDTFFEIYPNANDKPAQAIYNTIGGDLPGRIDYIFMKPDDRLQVIDSQIIFTNDIIGRVSDHFGVLTKVRFVR